MRIIFLDINGVLNSDGWFKTRPWWEVSIDTDAVAWLNRIVHATGAEVVISSSWRIFNTTEAIQIVLDAHGFQGKVIGKTLITPTPGKHRGAEIRTWLADQPTVRAFVVLDDDNAGMDTVRENLIQIPSGAGIDADHARRAIHILGGPVTP